MLCGEAPARELEPKAQIIDLPVRAPQKELTATLDTRSVPEEDQAELARGLREKARPRALDTGRPEYQVPPPLSPEAQKAVDERKRREAWLAEDPSDDDDGIGGGLH